MGRSPFSPPAQERATDVLSILKGLTDAEVEAKRAAISKVPSPPAARPPTSPPRPGATPSGGPTPGAPPPPPPLLPQVWRTVTWPRRSEDGDAFHAVLRQLQRKRRYLKASTGTWWV